MDPVSKRILIVEDNQDLRELMTTMLTLENYSILTANSGEEALELMSLHRFDLIVLDVMMPGMSGIEVLKKIRSASASHIKNLPVVVVTAKSLPDDVDEALLAGATSYLVKPFRATVLRLKIQNILDGTQ